MLLVLHMLTGTLCKTGVLVVHGLTGTPANMTPVTEALKAHGYFVEAPLLSGHGESVAALAKSTWKEWYNSIRKAHEALAQKVDKVFFVGLSMGSLLGLRLAEEVGSSLNGLAILGTPWTLRPIFQYCVIPGIRYTPLRWVIRSTAKNFEKSVFDPQGRDFYRQNSLGHMPGPSVFQMMDLLKVVKRDIAKVTQPLLMIHGANDHLADPQGLNKIKQGVSSKKVETLLLKKSAHVLTLDYEKEIVTQTVIRFFDSLTSA